MNGSAWSLSAVFGTALALGACALSPPQIDIEKQWTDAMGRLNLTGLYPPTEDVQIGDVFIHVPNSSASKSGPRFSWRRLATVSPQALLSELRDQQVTYRLAIKPLIAAKDGPPERPKVPTGNEWEKGVSGEPNCKGYHIGNADDMECLVRMQRSALPGVEVGRLTDAQIGAAGTFGNLGAKIGLGNSSATAVAITLKDVQELSLDAWRLQRLRREKQASVYYLAWAEDALFQLHQMRHELLQPACNGERERLEREGVEVVVVTRVLYAGTIEYNFTSNAQTAMKLAVDLQSALEGQPQAPQVPASLPKGSGDAATQAATPDAAGQRLASLLSSVTGETGTAAARAGASASLGIGTYGNLKLNQTFNRPMAVGAGARWRLSLHDLLAADPSLPAPNGELDANLSEFRNRQAQKFCTRIFGPDSERDARLRAAMRLPPRNT
jgi:hypothetical protein